MGCKVFARGERGSLGSGDAGGSREVALRTDAVALLRLEPCWVDDVASAGLGEMGIGGSVATLASDAGLAEGLGLVAVLGSGNGLKLRGMTLEASRLNWPGKLDRGFALKARRQIPGLRF
jgi:hypothetical protein